MESIAKTYDTESPPVENPEINYIRVTEERVVFAESDNTDAWIATSKHTTIPIESAQ